MENILNTYQKFIVRNPSNGRELPTIDEKSRGIIFPVYAKKNEYSRWVNKEYYKYLEILTKHTKQTFFQFAIGDVNDDCIFKIIDLSHIQQNIPGISKTTSGVCPTNWEDFDSMQERQLKVELLLADESGEWILWGNRDYSMIVVAHPLFEQCFNEDELYQNMMNDFQAPVEKDLLNFIYRIAFGIKP